MNQDKSGHEERKSDALADLFNSIRECEYLTIENTQIARTIKQSTPNAEKIAKIILEL